jgi:hypothetical protein
MALVRKSSFSESESESFLNSESFFEPGMLRLVELFEMVRTAAVPAGCRAPLRTTSAAGRSVEHLNVRLRLATALCGWRWLYVSTDTELTRQAVAPSTRSYISHTILLHSS